MLFCSEFLFCFCTDPTTDTFSVNHKKKASVVSLQLYLYTDIRSLKDDVIESFMKKMIEFFALRIESDDDDSEDIDYDSVATDKLMERFSFIKIESLKRMTNNYEESILKGVKVSIYHWPCSNTLFIFPKTNSK